jgi:hypothetical protein
MCGLRGQKMDAAELAAAIRRRFPGIEASLEADLIACEEAAWGETVTPRDALKLIQALHSHQEQIAAAAKPGRVVAMSNNIESKAQERAS